MSTLTVTITTPWAPVTIRLALVVMFEEDDSLILRSKTLCERLNIDEMQQMRGSAAASEGGASSTEATTAEVPARPSEVIRVRRVAFTIKSM